jgi:hypothetical protein
LRGSGWNAEALIQAQSGNNLSIEGCFFDQITGNGSSADTTGYSKSIEIWGGSGHVIRGNSFYGFESGGAVRFSNGGTGGLIENNYFYNPDTRSGANSNWAWAIVVRSCDGGTYIIRNNVIDLTGNGKYSSSNLRAMAFWDDHGSTTRKIFNNTVVGNGYGTGIHGAGSKVLLYNNIFYNLQTAYDNPSNITARNNIFYKVGSKVDGSFNSESNTSYDNPMIKTPSMSNGKADDAILTAQSSNAIDSGYEADADIPSQDFRDGKRNSVDIGAFEYDASISPSVPPSESPSEPPTPPKNLRILSPN